MATLLQNRLAQKKQKKLSKIVKRLPCGEGERSRLYSLMNKRVDALSTIALCKYRLQKEENTAPEIRSLKLDIKKNKRNEKLIEKDIRWMIKKARKRSMHSAAAFDWIRGAGLVLALVLAATVVYFWACGTDILEAIKGLLGN